MGAIINIIIYLIIAAIVLIVVDKLNLGLSVGGFMNAIIAAAVIAVVAGVVAWLLGLLNIAPGGGWFGAVVGIIIAAVVLLVSDRFLPGMKVNGFVGAIVAAVAIGVIYWLIATIFGATLQPLGFAG